MSNLLIHELDEVYVKFECEKSLAQELSDYFTFYVPGHQFSPAFKSKFWDGKIRLADLRTFTIYRGLVPYIKKFCKERNYSVTVDDKVSITENFSLIEAVEFIKTLNLPESIEVRDYQLQSFVHAVRNKRIMILSPTGSGKSLILYIILRYLQEADFKKGLLIVPTTSLVEQMYKDFQDYGYDSDKHCHRQYAGKDKVTDKFLTITTYYLRDDPEFNVFEKTRLLGNKYFHDYLETSKDVGVYIFDLSDYKKDWDYFLQGKYSKLSKDLKLIILSHYAKSKKNYVYVDSYLNPEMYFDIYSKLLECSPKLLKDVGELCDKPSLRKETLEITLKNLEKDGLSLNSH